jgi:hypothetical protein
VVSHIHRSNDEINPDDNIHQYPLPYYPHIVLVLPLHTDHRSCNNLVSTYNTSASAAMATNPRLTGALKDPRVPTELSNMLTNILAQLTTINKHLKLQGEVIACHDQILEGNSRAIALSPTKPVDGTGQGSTTNGFGTGGSNGNHGEGFHQPPTPHHGDFRDDLHNSFNKPKINFPRYDAKTDPLHGSTIVSPTSGGHTRWPLNKFGRPPCIWMVWLLSGIMP